MNVKWETENWNVSQANYWDEVREKFNIPENVIFHDATLRDGEQSPGVVFSKEDKINIAKQLDKLGIQRIEAGMPAVSQEDYEAIKEITKLGLKSKIFCFSRALQGDIEKAIDCGVDGVVIELTCGESRLRYLHPNWTVNDVIKQSVEAINFAKKNGLYVVYFPYDTTRANPTFLKELLTGVCAKSNPDAVAVVDTTGTIIPSAVGTLVRRVKEYTKGLPVEIHTHNDLGMGVANALAAVEAGAEVVHGCINGLGERCGNAAIEEIIVAAEALYGIDTGINTKLLKETCLMVEKISGVKLSFNKPIAGTAAYMKESGTGIQMANDHPLVTFPIGAEYVGASRELVLGKKSGKDSIKVKLKDMNIQLTDEKILDLLNQVKTMSAQVRRYLTDDEFKEMVKKAL